MTTRVTVEPSGHRIAISVNNYSTYKTDFENGTVETSSSTHTQIVLEPGAPPWVGYLTDTQQISLREIAAGVDPSELGDDPDVG
jgi:hypothetical protein